MPARGLELNGAGALVFPFTASIPPEIAAHLAEAAGAYHDGARAECLLAAARARDPDCLPVYFAQYKFYFYRNRLVEAERAALDGLDVAAVQGGFPVDWTKLHADAADWTRADGPSRFILFSLKALAFIHLRQGRTDESGAILSKLQEIDPADNVGASVIRALIARIPP